MEGGKVCGCVVQFRFKEQVTVLNSTIAVALLNRSTDFRVLELCYCSYQGIFYLMEVVVLKGHGLK